MYQSEKKIGEGMCNIITLITEQNGFRFCKKQQKSNLKEEDFELNPVVCGGKILHFLNKKYPSLKIPKVIEINEEENYYSYDYVDGTSYADVFDQIQDSTSIMSELGKFIALLSTITKEEVLALGIFDDTFDLHNEDADYEKELILPDFVREKYSYLEKMRIVAREYINDSRSKIVMQLIHDDLHKGNILINQKKLACIIDFGDCLWSDVHFEFVDLVFELRDKSWLQIVNLFEKETGRILDKKRIITFSFLRRIDRLSKWYDRELFENIDNDSNYYKSLFEEYNLL